MNKIAIVGCAPTSVLLAPYSDPSWSIWACSPNQATKLPRVDVWFDIHCQDIPSRGDRSNYRRWMAEQKCVVMQEHDPMIPGSIAYPLDEVIEVFGKGSPFFTTFLSSSFALMLAMALLKKPLCVGCWGFDLHHHSEYGNQRPGVHRLLEESYHLRIPVLSPPESDLMQPAPVYGFRERSPLWRRMEVARIEQEQRIEACKAKELEAKLAGARHEGALEQVLALQAVWPGKRNEMVRLTETHDGKIEANRPAQEPDHGAEDDPRKVESISVGAAPQQHNGSGVLAPSE